MADVTERVTAIYSSGQKVIQAENDIFGDSWPGILKSMHITFRHREAPKTAIVREGGPIVIPDGQEILSASYGKLDVTKRLNELYAQGQRAFHASNEVWTDSWPGIEKTFAIVYR